MASKVNYIHSLSYSVAKKNGVIRELYGNGSSISYGTTL